MVWNYTIPRAGFERELGPLDAARAAFEWLAAGPHPVSVDGRLFPGLPPRRVPLAELRDRLLRRRCPQALRDAAWAHLVLLSRTEGATWTVGCTGVALPALATIAGKLTARWAGDPADIDAAVLAGFLTELATIDLRKPRIMLRLRWAAYRAGHTAVREALDAPVPSGHGFRSTLPPHPWGHPDFVLARAVAEGAITADEAELIGSTRLEGVPLATAAEDRGVTYEAVKKTRQRAEHRLVAYLRDTASTESPAGPAHGDPATQATDALIITGGARAALARCGSSSDVTDLGAHAAEKVRRGVSPKGPETGVRGCGRTPATPAHTTSPDALAASSGTTPEVPRCA
ncbi:hypothetical protein ACIA8G_21840 [Lentzea sp. NPDC051213]|uniref:hypothetical protein n=1 Tax=Lentzea sp. NPDC051213 TaxID=3364126 RepID=UPI0037B3D1AB